MLNPQEFNFTNPTMSRANGIIHQEPQCKATLSNPSCLPCLYDRFRDIEGTFDEMQTYLRDEMYTFVTMLKGLARNSEFDSESNNIEFLVSAIDETFIAYLRSAGESYGGIIALEEMLSSLVEKFLGK